ncbi:MAG TPA: glycoside hydrolase family 3 N-terminal domain-containing protein [Candidatus Limnocylindrales bacterium]|nr:glycoside hydrolase family 3 N-terminal domain-containing protein [Candidatus Limnocylindrales bacterium]
MPPRQPCSRRTVLKIAVLGLVAAVAAACERALATPVASRSSTAPPKVAPSGAPGSPTATPGPTGPSPAPTGSSALPLREKIARLLIVGFRGLTVDEAPWIRRAIVEDGLGGVILFDRHRTSTKPRNIASPEQVRALTSELRALAPQRELFVAIDQEGGLVTRLSERYGYPVLPSEAAVGAGSEAAVRAWAEGLVKTIADAGINLNFAPVVDVDVNPDNPAIGAIDRSFSADPAVVARDAEIEVAAHRARNVMTALKHFPGLGSATANTDFGVSDVTATWTDSELVPYRDLLSKGLVDMIMAAHVMNGQLDRTAPASLSVATIDGLLRTDLGWDGVVVTDDMQAAAITDAFGFADSIQLAMAAGNDLLLFANQQVYEVDIVARIVDLVEGFVRDGTIAEARIDASIARVERLFAQDRVGG